MWFRNFINWLSRDEGPKIDIHYYDDVEIDFFHEDCIKKEKKVEKEKKVPEHKQNDNAA